MRTGPTPGLSTTHTWLVGQFHANHVAMQIGMRQMPSGTVEWFDAACRGGELTRTGLAPGSRPGVARPGGGRGGPPPPGGDGRDPPSRGLAAPAGRAGPALDPLGAARDPRRRRLRGGRDAAGAARPRRRLVGRRPGGQRRQGRARQQVRPASRRPGEGPRLPCPAPGGGAGGGRLGGEVRCPPGPGADLHGAGDVRDGLPGRGMEVLPGAGLGAALGRAPRGLAQAPRAGLAGGPAARAGTGSRLVRIDA